MATVDITTNNFSQTISQTGIVLLDWWAPWCGPCRAFGPVYEKASITNPDIVFGKINTEQEEELAARFAISSIPTLMVFREGALLYAEPGMLPANALAALIEGVRQLDMDAILRGSVKGEKQGAMA
jgi:thioredoxin